MDEEVQKLLDAAEKRGYDRQQKADLLKWYFKEKQRTASPAQDTTQPLSEYMQPLKEGQPPRPYTPLTAFARGAQATIADQIPEASALDAVYRERTRDFDTELLERFKKERASTGYITTGNKEDILQEAKKQYFGSDTKYQLEKNRFTQESRKKAIELLAEAKKQGLERQEKVEPFVQSRKDVKDVGSALEYAGLQAGQFLGQIPLSAATLGTSSKGMERAYAYQEMVDAIAAEKGISTEEVIELDLDKAILDYADTVGDINMILEQLGLVFGLGKAAQPLVKKLAISFLKKSPADAAKKEAAKGGLKQLASGAVGLAAGANTEGLTEALQEVTVIYQTALSQGKSEDEALAAVSSQMDRVWESYTAGTVGALGLGLGGRAISTTMSDGKADPIVKQQEKVEDTKAKAEAKVAEQRAKVQEVADKVDEILVSTTDDQVNTGSEENFEDFLAKNKALAQQVKEEELKKNVEKEEKKLQDLQVKELEKVVDTQIKEETKQPVDEKSTADTNGQETAPNVSQDIVLGSMLTNLTNTSRFREGSDAVELSNFVTQKLQLPVDSDLKTIRAEATKWLTANEQNLKNAQKEQTKEKLSTPKVEKQPKVERKETKVTTPEGTINLETGEVKPPRKKGRKVQKPKAEESKPTVDVSGGLRVDEPSVEVKPIEKKSPNPANEAIQNEQVKVKTMLKNRMKLAKPSQKLQRLKELVDNTIPQSKFPDQHQEVVDQARKEIQAIEEAISQRDEKRSKKQEKKKVEEAKKPTKKQLTQEQKEERVAKQEERAKKIESLEEEKKQYTGKYAELRDDKGNVLSPAIPQVRPLEEELESTERELKSLTERKKKLKDKAPAAMSDKIDRLTAQIDTIKKEMESGVKERQLWDPEDIKAIQEINEKIDKIRSEDKTADFTPEQVKIYDEYKAEGLDDETASALTDPDIVADMELFHGSINTFSKFSLSFIGTGQGAQAYGYGLYFTTLKDIANFYASKFSRGWSKQRPGKIYTVKYLKDEAGWMEWDEQLPFGTLDYVFKKLPKFKNNEIELKSYLNQKGVPYDPDRLTGGELYSKLSTWLGSDKKASEFLSGIFDGISFEGQSNATNYVVFDPKYLEITGVESSFLGEGAKTNQQAKWKITRQSTFSELISSLKNTDVTPQFKAMVDTMASVVNQALANENPTILYGYPDKSILGQAVRKDGKFYIVLAEGQNPRQENKTKLHELSHLFEFAVNKMQGGVDVNKLPFIESYQQIQKLYSSLQKDLQFEASRIEGKLKRGDKLTSKERLFEAFYKVDMYGLKDGREMVAEAMSNPEFATLLSVVSPAIKGKQSTKSYLETIYDAVKEMVLSAISAVSKLKDLQGTFIPDFDSSYLAEILNIFDNALKETKDGGLNVKQLQEIADNAFSDPDQSAFLEEKTEGAKKSKELMDKIYNRALKENITNLKQFKAFVTKVQQGLGVDLSPAQKAALTRRFNAKLQLDEYAQKAPDLIDKALLEAVGGLDKLTNMNENFIDYDMIKLGEMLLEVDRANLNQKGLKSYVDAAIAYASKDKAGLRKARQFAENYIAQTKVKDLLETDGFQFKKFGWGDKMARYVNLPTFLANISKYTQEHGQKLMKYFHDPLGRAHSETMLLVHRYLTDNDEKSALSNIATKNKLSEINFRRINAYGQVMSENPLKQLSLEQRIVNYQQMLNARLAAVKDDELKGVKEADVLEEIREFKSMVPAILQGGSPLSEGEQEYYNRARQLMDMMKQAVKTNTEVVHNDEFVEINNYLPSFAIGSIAVKQESGSTTSGQSDVQENLSDALNTEKRYRGMTIGQSGFEKARTGGKGIYYETNLHTVMARYLQSTIFDVMAAQEVQILDRMFQGENVIKLKDEMTAKNVRLLKGYLMDAIKSFKQPAPDYSTFTKLALDAKNLYQTAKIGTQGQFFNQLVAMVPAIAVQTGIGNTTSAVNLFVKAKMGDQDVKFSLQELLSRSSQIPIRDFFFEKYESIEDVAKAGVSGRIARGIDKLSKLTTATMTWADKAAVSLNFISAFIEAGGDVMDKTTWTPERIAAADLKYTVLQNVSSSLFVAPVLKQRQNDLSAISHAAFWSFKSFALNAMTNAWLATPQAVKGNTEAAKVAGAHLTSALFFEGMNSAVKVGYGLAFAAAYAALTGEDFEEPEEYNEENILSRLTNAFYSFFFGGLPVHADAVVKFMLDKGIEIGTQEKSELLYAPDKPKDLVAQFAGIYGNMLLHTVLNPVELVVKASTGVNQKEETKHKIIGKMFAEWVALIPFIPYRGDVSKIINTGLSYEAESKRNEAKRRKKRKPNRRKYY